MNEKRKTPLRALLVALPTAAAAALLIRGYMTSLYMPLLMLLPLILTLPLSVGMLLLVPTDGRLKRPLSIICGILLAALYIAAAITPILLLPYFTVNVRVSYATAVAAGGAFFLLVIADRVCRSFSDKGRSGAASRSIRSGLLLARFMTALVTVALLITVLRGYDGQPFLKWAIIIALAYELLFAVASSIVLAIKRALFETPSLSVPLPFCPKDDGDLSLLSYLEENTGITMRSLWSMKLLRGLIPIGIFACILLIWLSTGITTVDEGSEAARYRLGRLDRDHGILGEGLHFTLPMPFDRVEVYNVDRVSELTIGYSDSGKRDNLWTEAHGGTEYKLLLGGGNELISLNIRVQYKIDDLYDYLTVSCDPVALLSSSAYRIATERVISTDVRSMLSLDRTVLADEMKRELSEISEARSLGLSVVGVIIESIHPPVEVAEVFQQVISAEIEATRTLTEAEAEASVKLIRAYTESDSLIKRAEADKYGAIAKANAEVADFVAACAADTSYGNAYRYYKYMSAVRGALSGRKLYILGDGVDEKYIYFGDRVIVTQ